MNLSNGTSGVYGDEIVVWFAPAFNFVVSISIFILVYAISFIFLNKRNMELFIEATDDRMKHRKNVNVKSLIFDRKIYDKVY